MMDTHDAIPDVLMRKIRVMSECNDVREMPEHAHYAITPDGRIYSVKPRGVQVGLAKIPRLLKSGIYKGIPYIKLQKDDRTQSTMSLLRCVALAFIGLPNHEDDFASPIDGDPTHISPDNVQWISHSDATKRGVERHGGAFTFGEKQWMSKLTPELVSIMKDEYTSGLTFQEIADSHGVTRRTAARAIRGTAWKQVGEGIDTEITNHAKGTSVSLSKLDENKVREIRERIASKESLSSIARVMGVNVGAIWSIKVGRTWKHVA